jgi:UDP-glucose 4-epimerase
MKLLIPGGAGYIGSHMVKYLQDRDNNVTVLDNFSTGHRWAVNDCEVIEVDLLDQNKLSKVLKNRSFDGVIHFAAKSLIGESNEFPEIYYRNNVVGTMNLVEEMLKNNINNLVFSSTAAIFGIPKEKKIKEDHEKMPINPYGKSKLIIETILSDISKANQLNVTCLRYFNAAGADLDGEIGEEHEPETHLIPNILNSIKKIGEELKVFGNDYNTHDGTCVRDYIHVLDLAQAHLLSIENFDNNPGFFEYNIGNGNGFSVFEVIKACEEVSEKEIPYSISPRRIGDPDYLVADSSLAKKELGWEPKFKELNKIIASAWKWHERN